MDKDERWSTLQEQKTGLVHIVAKIGCAVAA